MAQSSPSVIGTVGQPGPSTTVASGNAPNSNPSNTPRIAHTHPPADAVRDGAEPQGVSASNSGKFDWQGDRMLHIYMRDYLVRRNFTKAAQVLASEANIGDDERPPMEVPQGLLFEWWVVLWDLLMAKTGEGGGGSQSAHLYLQAHKQQSLTPGQPNPMPHGSVYPYSLAGYPGQGGPQTHTLPSGFQPQTMPVQERTAQQQNGQHPNGLPTGQMAVTPTGIGPTPRPPVGQSNGPQSTQNSQPLANSGQLVASPAYPSQSQPQPSQVHGIVHGQTPWHQFSQGHPGMQGPTAQSANPLASQQGPMHPSQTPVQSQIRAAQEYSQTQLQQHASMLRQQSATGANGAPQQQSGPAAMTGQPDRTPNAYPNPNVISGVPGGVNGNTAVPSPPSGPGQPPQAGPYPPQPYQAHTQQHHPQTRAQNQNQPNPYPSMLPPSFPQPPQRPQTNPPPQTPRMQPGGPQTPGSGTQHLVSTPQQAPLDNPRTHPQQPQNFSFPSQQFAGPNGAPNTPMNHPFTLSSQQQQQQQQLQQQRSFDGATNTPVRPGTSMLPPQQPARTNAPVGLINPRFNPPQQQQFGGPPQPQQHGALGPGGYSGAMGTGGILPSGAGVAIHHGTGVPTPHPLNSFMSSQSQQQQQLPPQPAPQSQPVPQSQSHPLSQSQSQPQPQSSTSAPLPNGHAPNLSRAPTPAQQQQSVTNVQRSATSTPAPNSTNVGSNNVSPAARGTSVARTGVGISPQSDAALQALLQPGPPGRQPAQQQQPILAMRGGLIPGRPFNGPPGSFAGGAVSTPQQQAQHEVHAGMKRTGSPSNDAGDLNDSSSPDVKRPRRNSQGAADGNAPGAPAISNGVGRVGILGNEAGRQMLQLHQGSRRPAAFSAPAGQSHPATPNGIAMRSPQPSSIPPPSNALSEHASAQITAAAAAAGPANRPAGLNPPASRPQQSAAARSGPSSPPSGAAHKAAMPPPQQAVAPSPLTKDQGKGPNAQINPASEQPFLNPSRAPSSTPKLTERKPPTPAPGPFPQPSNPLTHLANDPADESSPSLSKPSPSTSGGSTTNNSINMQANFNSIPYDNGIYMSDQFGGVDFGMPEMFRDGLRDGAFSEPNDMFMMDFDAMLADNKTFDSSNNDDYTSVGHF